MRQFSTKFTKEFISGLKDTSVTEVNSMKKLTFTDVFIDNNQIQTFDLGDFLNATGVFTPTNLFTYGIAYDGKFPQIFEGKEMTILNYYGRLFKLDEDNDVLIELPVERQVNTNKHFTFIDNGNDWWLVNSDLTIHYNDGTLVSYVAGINTGIFIQGRLVYGGIDTKMLTLSDYSLFKNATSNTIVWSPVGGVNMDAQFADTIIDLSYLEGLDFGYTSVKGDVLCIVPFREGFVVGTSKMVYYCTFIVGDVLTLSVTKLLGFGILNEHSILNLNGVLYIIGKSGTLYQFVERSKELGFAYLISDMTTPYMLGDDKSNTLFICDGSISYMYYNENMSKLSDSISGITNY